MAAAREAIGVRFRLHGRAPAEGLDCVGLAAFALAGGGFSGAVPSGYRLRGGDDAQIAALLRNSGLFAVDHGRAGDLALARSGPGQLHLAILIEGGFVHADAMLRRVVERPGAMPWPTIGYWRFLGSAS